MFTPNKRQPPLNEVSPPPPPPPPSPTWVLCYCSIQVLLPKNYGIYKDIFVVPVPVWPYAMRVPLKPENTASTSGLPTVLKTCKTGNNSLKDT